GLVRGSHDQGARYEPVDSCIQFLYQLDGKHVVTVEGLCAEGVLHPVQQALVDHHGSQCGYCTPGFVMALAGAFERPAAVDRDGLCLALTGNLCRCTGYLPILEAGLALDRAAVTGLAERYPSRAMLDDLGSHARVPVRIESGGAVRKTFFGPRTLEEAVAFKAQNPGAVVVSGGTELGVLRNKKGL